MFVISVPTSKWNPRVYLPVMATVLIGFILLAVLAAKPQDDAAIGEQYLASLGYQATAIGKPAAFTVPAEPDTVLEQYNELQVQVGFDLLALKNRVLKRYDYAIANFPDRQQVVAHLLIYKGRVVGGDFSDPSENGFLLGLHPITIWENTLE